MSREQKRRKMINKIFREVSLLVRVLIWNAVPPMILYLIVGSDYASMILYLIMIVTDSMLDFGGYK